MEQLYNVISYNYRKKRKGIINCERIHVELKIVVTGTSNEWQWCGYVVDK